jgi:hypothetical protein
LFNSVTLRATKGVDSPTGIVGILENFYVSLNSPSPQASSAARNLVSVTGQDEPETTMTFPTQ